jgi:hypothetical protein
MSEITSDMVLEALKMAKQKYRNNYDDDVDGWSTPRLGRDAVYGSDNDGYRFYFYIDTPQGILKLSANTAKKDDSIVSVKFSSDQPSKYWKKEVSGG